ncbi:hypothetical protein RHMOL_Rhmol06G0163400 [Rhododendron molle]|uniref:Uncharacterized protein n=1 Tax=Rhododendron molle TaxID=49168 RepID=A0ACC0NDJ8_RHOML|nr:hypothetical protein RHMOL_Rhmol06G0163400 [Rhododendron molle]
MGSCRADESVISDNGENVVAKIRIKPVTNGWFLCSVVAKLHKLMTITEIERGFLSLGGDNIQVRAMGG